MHEIINITDETGRTVSLSSSDYEMIADYVRKMDRIDLARKVLSKYCSSFEKKLCAFENFIVNDEKRLEHFAANLNEYLMDHTGEMEWEAIEAVEEIRKEYALGIYVLVSNKGTIEEQRDKVILPQIAAQLIKDKQMKESLYLDNEEFLDPAYIDEVFFLSEYAE